MKAKDFYILLLLCLFFCGCENKQMSDKARAELCLQTLRTKDKEKQPLADCDSLTHQAIDYYSKTNKPMEEAEMWFYKARICTEKEETEKAVKNYHAALRLLNGKKEHLLLAKIYANIGDIYCKNDLYRSALSSFRKAFYNDSILNGLSDMCFDIRDIGRTYLFLEKEDSARHYFDRAYAMSKKLEDPSLFLSYLYTDYLYLYTDNGDYKQAFHYLSLLEKLPVARARNIASDKGALFNKIQQYDSAYYYLNQSARSEDIYERVSSYDELRIAAKGMGDYQKATKYAEMYEAGIDSTERLNRTLEIQKVESERAFEQIKSKHIRIEAVFIILLFCVFISAIFVYKLNKAKSTTHQETTPLKKKQKESSLSSLPVQSLELMPIYKRIADLPKEKKEISSSNQKPFTPEEFDELMRTVKTIFPEFLQQLHTACPLLTEEDIIFCCLVKANLSRLTISYCFMTFDTNPLKQRKKRIKQKLTIQTDNKELFESIFPN